jgi:hypothetical protein
MRSVRRLVRWYLWLRDSNTYFDFSPETSANKQSASSFKISSITILTHDGGLSGLVSVVLSLLMKSRISRFRILGRQDVCAFSGWVGFSDAND